MTKVRCSMVMSPNGYIARLNGDEEWISEVNWTDFLADAKACNCIVVGRDTYETVMKLYKDYNFDSVDCEYKIIVTNQSDYPAKPGYFVVHSPEEAVSYLKSKHVPEILLAGGGKLNASFAEAGLIDELEFILEPYLIGNGRQVLAIGDFESKLELIKSEVLKGSRVRSKYRVIKS